MSTAPDATTTAWLALCSNDPRAAELLARARATDHAPSPAQVTRLRAAFAAHEVHAALELVKAQRRNEATHKLRGFPTPDSLRADPEGLEMATHHLAAAHKARRFAAAAHTEDSLQVIDACSGIGGDTLELARAGLRVLALDARPVRAACCNANVSAQGLSHARCEQRDLASLLETTPPARLLHIDPARRDGPARSRAWDELLPGPALLAPLLTRFEGCCLKQRPGIDLDDLPEWLPHLGEIEIISQRGSLSAALLWSGSLAHDTLSRRRATLLRSDSETHTLAHGLPTPDVPLTPGHTLGNFLYEPDDSIERAGLLGLLCLQTGLRMPHDKGGVLTGDSLVSNPFLTPFEVLASLPWRDGREHRLRDVLRSHNAGEITVKTRGKLANPDVLAPKLSQREGQPLTLFILRFGHAEYSILTKRLTPTALMP